MEQGLTLGEVLLLEGIFAVSLALLDAPSGYFADTCGRKRSISVGSLMFLVGGGCYLTGSTFVDFLIAELFFALGLALVGGADHALLYDSLAEENKESDFQRICGNLFCLEMASSAVGAVLGGLLALLSLSAPFFVTVSGFTVMFFISLTLIEPGREVRDIAGSKRLGDFFKVLKGDVLSSRAILWLIGFWATLFASMQVGFWLYQPYMELCGIAVAHFGWIYACMNLFGAYWARNAYRVENRLGFGKAIVLAAVLVSEVSFYFRALWEQ
jgi:MFS family permease